MDDLSDLFNVANKCLRQRGGHRGGRGQTHARVNGRYDGDGCGDLGLTYRSRSKDTGAELEEPVLECEVKGTTGVVDGGVEAVGAVRG